VATEHSLGTERIEGRPLTPFARHLYLATERLGSATIAVSATVGLRLLLWGVPTERIVVIGNGIEAETYRFDPAARERTRTAFGIPPDRFVVGSVGRLVPGKRVEHVLRSLPVDATALVVGGGPEAPGLVALARELDIEAVFTGETAGVSDLLSAMDLLVFASAEETFGVAVVEALAAGLPVLFAACPAVDNLPSDLRAGLPGVRRLAADLSDLRPALAEAARSGPSRQPVPDAVAEYDIAAQAARIDELYARLTPSLTSDRGGQ
jgi:glycosyltransferase involved in cell wall biosynthesis